MFISLHLASDMILIDFPIYLADFSIIKSKSRSIQSETDNTLMFPCLWDTFTLLNKKKFQTWLTWNSHRKYAFEDFQVILVIIDNQYWLTPDARILVKTLWPKKKLLFPFPINPLLNNPWFLHVCSTSLLKRCTNRRNCDEQFLLFPQCFLPFWRTFSYFHLIQKYRLHTLSVWNSLKFVVRERVKARRPIIHVKLCQNSKLNIS